MTDDLGTAVLVTGAIGEPGQRGFYLQGQSPLGTHPGQCGEGQVGPPAEPPERPLADLPPIRAPNLTPTELRPPWDPPRFVLGTIGLAYDGDSDRVVVVLEELVVADEDDPDATAVE